jgi:hypothetical protein
MPSYKIVISKFNEPLDWLDILDRDNVIVYNKSEETNPEYIPLKNIGREADTFLYYIIQNYDNLPDYVIFLQGDPFSHMQYTQYTLENSIIDILKTCPSDVVTFNYECNQPNSVYPGLLLDEYFKYIFDNPVPTYYKFYPGCQYIVPKHRIKGYPKHVYQRLRFMLQNNNMNNYTAHFGSNQFDKWSINPWTFERLAYYLFTNTPITKTFGCTCFE